MFSKQKIQALNRIVIPTAVMNDLNLSPGDEIYVTSDGERVYISPSKEKIPRLMAVFERNTGTLLTRGNYQPLTDTKFKPITKLPYKKTINPELIEEGQ